jgi:hypothetical protein
VVANPSLLFVLLSLQSAPLQLPSEWDGVVILFIEHTCGASSVAIMSLAAQDAQRASGKLRDSR